MSSSRPTVFRRSEELVGPDAATSWTLPSWLYLDPAVLERERRDLFGRTWQIVGRREQLAKPGDYFTTELVGEPLLIVRAQNDRTRGFYNICRHRAGPPATGCGNRKVFRCGYHGWTYGLDGALVNAPEMDGTADFDRAEFGLHPVATAEWGAWIFANLNPNAEPLEQDLCELPQQASRYGLKTLKLYKRHDYVMDCNWKVYVDNYLEGYHLPSVHPSLNRELDYGQYVTETYERHSRQYSTIRGPDHESSVQRRYAQAKGDEVVNYFWKFPNWMLNCYPDNTSLNIVLPLGVEKTVAIFEWYFPEEVLQTDAPARTAVFSDEIQIEDGQICEVVHRNLKSKSYERGRFSAKQERCVHHFHRLYSEWMEKS